MNFITFAYNEESFRLIKQVNGTWLFTLQETDNLGNTPDEVSVTVDNGRVAVDSDDEKLTGIITVFIQTLQTMSGTRMMGYYPYVIQVLLEYQANMQAVGLEIDYLKQGIQEILNNAFIQSADESRIEQWENFFGITPGESDSLADRRAVILARYRGGTKLNEQSINDIVNAFTNGYAVSYFKSSVTQNGESSTSNEPPVSTIYVEVAPPDPDRTNYNFDAIVRELALRKPAHLALDVSRHFSTWQDIANDFTSWQDVRNRLTRWQTVYNYVNPNG